MELDTLTATWLTSDNGRSLVAEVTSRLDDGDDELTVATSLRRRGVRPEQAAATVTAAVARRRSRVGRSRWPAGDHLLFTRETLEQASDPRISAWRAERFARAARRATGSVTRTEVWDLCSGAGGDAIALARAGLDVTCVERDAARATLRRHNLDAAGVSARVVVGDALDVAVPEGALVHVDPSRRVAGRRVHRLDDHEPAVGAILAAHRHVAGIGVTVSPGVDPSDPALRLRAAGTHQPPTGPVVGDDSVGAEPSGDRAIDAEVEYLQSHDDLVEATVWFGALRGSDAAGRRPHETSATLLPEGEHRAAGGDRAFLEVGEVAGHLVVVAPAAVRARLHDAIGAEIGAHRLARHRALLTCADPPAPSPWYRCRPVVAVLSAQPGAVRRWLRDADPHPVEVVLHGADRDPERFWREVGRPPRGPQGWRLEIVRRDRDTIVVVTDATAAPGR